MRRVGARVTRPAGFTIVELLIVIVVIAILAAITVVAFNGVQQRSNNSAIISAASQYVKLVKAYVATNDKYPITTDTDACVTTGSGCKDTNGTQYAANTTLDAQLATIGSLPRSIPTSTPDGYGIFFTYYSTQKMNGVSQPLRMTYFLNGLNQNCGMSNITSYNWPTYSTSTTGYTSNLTEKTLCWVSIPGPSA